VEVGGHTSIKSIVVMVIFLVGLVATFIRGLDKNSPYAIDAKQMGPYNTETETPQTPTITAAEAHA
jgi:hypothetical protein